MLKHNRKYPDIHIGDTVKHIPKINKNCSIKAMFLDGSKELYNVESMLTFNGLLFSQTRVQGYTIQRHEILKSAKQKR